MERGTGLTLAFRLLEIKIYSYVNGAGPAGSSFFLVGIWDYFIEKQAHRIIGKAGLYDSLKRINCWLESICILPTPETIYSSGKVNK